MDRPLAALAAAVALVAGTAAADPTLTLADTRALDGGITIETGEFRLAFSERFNGGIHRWFDLSADPGASDNLTTASYGGIYNTGTLFDYDVYLGFGSSQVNEFMTTVGMNAAPGALELEILESTPVRARILQKGHPRLNNATGPPGDPFIELGLVDATTIWTIYPTGKVAIEFRAERNPAGEWIDSGPGGAGRRVISPGPAPTTVLTAGGGADFLAVFATSGDTIESPGGGWGPLHIVQRLSATQLSVESSIPPGSYDYVIRRNEIQLETISIHADGDPTIVAQCSDPAVSRWQGGSNGDAVWDRNTGDGCGTLFRDTTVQGGNPPIAGDVILAHWTRDRAAGSLLAFFESWPGVNGGFFNDSGFTDISYTQLGRFGVRPFAPLHRHFLAHMGSSAASVLPAIRSVAAALPYGEDYRTPFAEALVGSLSAGPEIASYGFDPGTGAYTIAAHTGTAVIRFDAAGGSRAGRAYLAPVVDVTGLSADDALLSLERSTDGGATFQDLAPGTFNVTSQADEAQLGAGRRIFQYLGAVPASATGASAWAFRFRAGEAPEVPGLRDRGAALLAAALALTGLEILAAARRPREERRAGL